MKLAYDLHIHSILSPCADDLMTPNNILNMAMLNKLDIISVTDHNSVKQLDSITQIAKSYDFILIPGLEVQVEDAHVLCYFNDLDLINEFSQFLEMHLIKQSHDSEQLIMDIYDSVIDSYPHFLLTNVDISFTELLHKVKELNGITILAHLDRDKFSALKLLNESNIKLVNGIELTNHSNISLFLNQNPLIKNKPILINSDSHQIINISLRENFLDLDEKSIEGFFKCFKL